MMNKPKLGKFRYYLVHLILGSQFPIMIGALSWIDEYIENNDENFEDIHLQAIYRVAHSCNPMNSCYHEHTNWRYPVYQMISDRINNRNESHN